MVSAQIADDSQIRSEIRVRLLPDLHLDVHACGRDSFWAFAEYSLSLDAESESMRDIGQRQPLVTSALAMLGALGSRYRDKLERFILWQEKERKDPDEPTELYENMRRESSMLRK